MKEGSGWYMSCSKGQQRWEMTLTQAAVYLGRSKFTVYRWLKQSAVPIRYATVGGNRHLLVRRAQVVRLQKTIEQRERSRRPSPIDGKLLQTRPAAGQANRSFRVINAPPAQATQAYRQEYAQLLRAWKRTV